ncbi:hypothetical protein EI94DRAFT_1737760, partial [Lactarius quietus]
MWPHCACPSWLCGHPLHAPLVAVRPPTCMPSSWPHGHPLRAPLTQHPHPISLVLHLHAPVSPPPLPLPCCIPTSWAPPSSIFRVPRIHHRTGDLETQAGGRGGVQQAPCDPVCKLLCTGVSTRRGGTPSPPPLRMPPLCATTCTRDHPEDGGGREGGLTRRCGGAGRDCAHPHPPLPIGAPLHLSPSMRHGTACPSPVPFAPKPGRWGTWCAPPWLRTLHPSCAQTRLVGQGASPSLRAPRRRPLSFTRKVGGKGGWGTRWHTTWVRRWHSVAQGRVHNSGDGLCRTRSFAPPLYSINLDKKKS